MPHLRTSILIAFSCLSLVTGVAGAAEDNDGYDQGRAGWGAFVVPVPLDLQAQLNLAPGEGGLVVHVRDGGTADSLGLSVGDVVLSVNGAPITSVRDIRPIVRVAAPGESIEVTAIMNNVTRDLEGTFAERIPRTGGRPLWANGNGPRPGWWQSPDKIVAEQRAQLAADSIALDSLRQVISKAQSELAAQSQPRPPNWQFSFSCRVGDDQ